MEASRRNIIKEIEGKADSPNSWEDAAKAPTSEISGSVNSLVSAIVQVT